MKYTVEYLTDKNVVDIKMRGRLNYQIAEQYSKEALKLAHQNDCTKFLFDHKDTTMRGVTNIHASGDELQQFGFKNTDRIAIVIENRKSDPQFVESENRNNSWSLFKYFSPNNIDEAMDWLMRSES